MDIYTLEQNVTNLNRLTNDLSNNAFYLANLVQSNIYKEMWNLLSLEEKRKLTTKVYENISNSLIKQNIINIDFKNILSFLNNKDNLIKEVFIENESILNNLVKNVLLDKIKILIEDIKNNREIIDLIYPEIFKIVKQTYQTVLSHNAENILKETQKLIIKLTSEKAIITYGEKLIQKATKIVNEEIVKELLE